MEPTEPEERESSAPASGGNDAARRWESIRQLGASHLPDASPRTAPELLVTSRRLPLWRRGQTWVTALVLVALAAGLAVTLAPRAGAPTARARPSALVQIAPLRDRIACPTDMEWSRSQQLIAVLGYTGTCPRGMPGSGLPLLTQGMYRGLLEPTDPDVDSSVGALAIYSAGKGQLITQERLDKAIYARVRFPKAYVDWLRKTFGRAPETMVAINYTHVLWSSDGQRLYVTFDIFVPDGPPSDDPGRESRLPGHLVDGLLVVAGWGGAPTVYLHRASSNVGGVTVWDLATGAVRVTIPAASPFALSPAGLGYAWSGDTLTVQHPATPGAAPPPPMLGPVGAPQAGASAFTVWQPGVVADTLADQAAKMPNLSGVPTFTADFVALSPDGSLLAAGLGLSAALVSGANPAHVKTMAAYGWGAVSHLSPRDAALSAAAALPTMYIGWWNSQLVGAVAVAWRPDGRELAMRSDATGDTDPYDAHEQVIILSCATGKKLATLTPPPLNGGDPILARVTLLRWTPDGRSLAFYDALTGVITIWDYTRLPN